MTPPNTRIFIIAEGQSEESFINAVIKPAFETNQIYIIPIRMDTSKGYKGGDITFDRFQFNALNKIKEDRNCFITTMFDFYGLGKGFPIQETANINSIYQKAEYIENYMHSELQKFAKNNGFEFRPERFIPYIQLHELEGLFFSDIEKLCSTEPNWHKFIPQLQKIRNDFETPEHINNSFDTKPSRRLENILSPVYSKKTNVRLAPIIGKKITLETIEKECLHFHQWLEKLRNLPKL